MKFDYRNHQNHEMEKIDWVDIKENPGKYGYTDDEVAVKTVPGQSLTVKEIVTRYEKGRPLPQE